ncbi:MAG TPA: M28 family peptidase [Vicinamibacterales bacterium]|nr:M28 family peptidase [Vicinamibacterales bacterium]
MSRLPRARSIAWSACLAVALGLTVSGQAPARGPITPHAYPLDDEHYVGFPLPPGEQAYARIDGPHLKQYVNEITAISRRSRDDGNQYWGRISGTKYDDMAEAWVEGKFKAFGLQSIRRQYFDLPPQWFPTKWQVTASGSGQRLVLPTVRPAARSVATPSGGLELEAVWVGIGTEADFAGRAVTGKAVVIYSIPAPSVINHSANYLGAIKRAEERGAAAVIVVLGIPGNLSSELNGGADTVPTFSLGIDDGTHLRELIEHGSARVRMELAVENRSGLKDASVWGELPGTTDEDIIVMAHHDAYFQGALDNASGMATMVGLAEYFSKIPKEQRRRTIKFVTTSGHHNGSLGVKWMHDNRTTFLAKTALLLNCEHVSVTQTYYWGQSLRKADTMDARRWWVYGSDTLATLALDAYRTFGVAVYHEMEPNASGDMGQASLDAPSVQMIESPAFYHTDYDTPEIVPASGLEAVARAYAKLIDSVNGTDRRNLSATPSPNPSRQQGR